MHGRVGAGIQNPERIFPCGMGEVRKERRREVGEGADVQGPLGSERGRGRGRGKLDCGERDGGVNELG